MQDLLGYAASCAVLATFLMRSMVSLRLIAIIALSSIVVIVDFSHPEQRTRGFSNHRPLLAAKLKKPRKRGGISCPGLLDSTQTTRLPAA